ncbi:hypothetical protein ACHAXS_013613, partial [Conticribra weissflogii]
LSNTTTSSPSCNQPSLVHKILLSAPRSPGFRATKIHIHTYTTTTHANHRDRPHRRLDRLLRRRRHLRLRPEIHDRERGIHPRRPRPPRRRIPRTHRWNSRRKRNRGRRGTRDDARGPGRDARQVEEEE